MLSRRLLRIKVLHTCYACELNSSLLHDPLKFLETSIEKSNQLYLHLLCLALEMKHIEIHKNEVEKNKFFSSSEPQQSSNYRFVDNSILQLLENNKTIQRLVHNNNSFWHEDDNFHFNLYKNFKQKFSNQYKHLLDYNFENQQQILIDFYNKYLYNDRSLYELLEEKSIFWNDEIDFWLKMIVKNIKSLSEDSKIFPLFKAIKDETDLVFSQELLLNTIKNINKNKALIEAHLSAKWEYDRLALMDKLIISLAITEIRQIQGIPVRSSFNEYIEIAKLYSTPKSSKFVNGILDSIIKELNKQHKIKINK